MSKELSPIDFEVIRHRIATINEDAAATLKRVSGSQIAVEASDLNTVVMAADGRVVACGRYVLIQVASMHLVVADVLANYGDNPGIGPGDQFITNDPYVGTLHQPDVVVVAPIFDGERLVAWCASVVHQADVGGPTPGGITYDARSIFDEAIPMAPMKIVEAGRIRGDIEREYLIRSRTPELNGLDLAGQIAANREAAGQILELCRRYGTETLMTVMDRLLSWAEQQLRLRLAALPDGCWRHVAYVLHHDRTAPEGRRDRNYAVRLTMTKRGDRLELDFSDSSDQAPGAINATRAALVNFAMASILIYLCNGLPWVPGGVWPVVDIVSRTGSVVDARWPAGVAMSTSSTGQAVRICVNACVARILEASEELAGTTMASCQSAGAGACTISGVDDRGRSYATMTTDDISGGGGARRWADGADSSGFTTSPGASVANVEVNESYLPILYLMRRELADSGGPGRRRGGVGTAQLLTPYEVRNPVGVLSFGQGLQHPTAVGVAGGEPGGRSGFAIIGRSEAGTLAAEAGVAGGPQRDRHPGGAALRPAPLPTAGMTVNADQVQLVVSQGGGGFGDPLERDPAQVLADFREGLVSAEGAARDYGVVLVGGGAAGVAGGSGHVAIDDAATLARREEIRRRRLGGRPPAPAAAVPPENRTGRGVARRLSAGFVLIDDTIECRRCGHGICPATDNLYEFVVIDERPCGPGPLGLSYPGSDEFVVRHCYCPHCAAQFDVQIGRADEPVLRAVEPLPAASHRVPEESGQ